MDCLADVNLLIALADPAQVFHDRARHWLAAIPATLVRNGPAALEVVPG